MRVLPRGTVTDVERVNGQKTSTPFSVRKSVLFRSQMILPIPGHNFIHKPVQQVKLLHSSNHNSTNLGYHIIFL